MTASLQAAVGKVAGGADLTAEEMHAAVSSIMDGGAAEALVAALLTALRMKGEAVDEIVGAARAMRERVTRIPVERAGLLDTCGTGGDRLHTFNISTATALVAASAGVPVAKHGNRGVSSSSGSADVLEALGINIQLSPEQVARCLQELGIGFCFAPLLHGAMKHAAPVRRQLGFRTIFNLLGPLTNPADAECQLLGANDPGTAEKLARALSRLGCRRAYVVSGGTGLDEVSLWDETAVYEISDGDVRTHGWSAATFGLPECRVEDLTVASAEESASVIREVLEGRPGPARDVVVANAAAALMAARPSESPASAAEAAAEAIDSGRAAELCGRLAEFTTGLRPPEGSL